MRPFWILGHNTNTIDQVVKAQGERSLCEGRRPWLQSEADLGTEGMARAAGAGLGEKQPFLGYYVLLNIIRRHLKVDA